MSLPDDNKSFVGFFFRLPVKKFENTFVKNKWRKKKNRSANVRDDTQNNKLLLVNMLGYMQCSIYDQMAGIITSISNYLKRFMIH